MNVDIDEPRLPLVSIIVPSFNQGRFIGETLASILDQTYRPLELLVIDGASTDETLDVLRAYDHHPELRWVSEPDSGVVEAVNKGLAMALGEFAAIQSSDDCYEPGAIGRAVSALQADPALGFVFGDIRKVTADGSPIDETRLAPFSIEAVLALETWIPQPSTFFRLALARELGGWRESAPYAADTGLWFRMMFAAGARKLDAVLARRRIHPEQRDRQGDRIVRDYRRMLAGLEPLAAAPRRLRDAASAGALLLANRYDPESGYWKCYFRSILAATLSPVVRRSVPVGSLVPGYGLARRWVSRFRQGMKAT